MHGHACPRSVALTHAGEASLRACLGAHLMPQRHSTTLEASVRFRQIFKSIPPTPAVISSFREVMPSDATECNMFGRRSTAGAGSPRSQSVPPYGGAALPTATSPISGSGLASRVGATRRRRCRDPVRASVHRPRVSLPPRPAALARPSANGAAAGGSRLQSRCGQREHLRGPSRRGPHRTVRPWSQPGMGGLAVSTHATTPFSPSRSARSQGERLRPAAVFEP